MTFKSIVSTLVLGSAVAACGGSKVPADVSDSLNNTDQDRDGVAASLDCDDADPDVGGPTPLFMDTDGDGFGVDETETQGCPQTEGYVSVAGDCDDEDAAVNPAADEICDGVDNDCNTEVDEGLLVASYEDVDGDGYGDEATSEEVCTLPEGKIGVGGDCNDDDALINPGADEVCDEVDNNCDGVTDDDAIDVVTFYMDGDGDGYGVEGSTLEACAAPEGYSALSGDCDDGSGGVNPGMAEACDGLDTDCDGDTDEDYACECYGDDAGSELGEILVGVIEDETDDLDLDCGGGGRPEAAVLWTAPRTGTFTITTSESDFDTVLAVQSSDCDEELDCHDDVGGPPEDPFAIDPSSRIDITLEEGDAVTIIVEAGAEGSEGTFRVTVENADLDEDGYDDSVDCDDEDASSYPGADEVCDDADNDCDGVIDEGVTYTRYEDEDGDGYGVDGTEFETCTPYIFDLWGGLTPVGASEAGDCDDGNEDVYPGALDWHAEPYLRFVELSIGGGIYVPSWDYNCDGEEEQIHPEATTASCSALFGDRASSGSYPVSKWDSTEVPACGETGDYRWACVRIGGFFGSWTETIGVRTQECR